MANAISVRMIITIVMISLNDNFDSSQISMFVETNKMSKFQLKIFESTRNKSQSFLNSKKS